MRAISTMALAISAFAALGGAAYAESTMSSGDLIKEMHPDSDRSDLQTGRNAAGGEGPSIGGAAEEDASDASDAGGSDQFLRRVPAAPDADVQ
jgi:hypothetical protein